MEHVIVIKSEFMWLVVLVAVSGFLGVCTASEDGVEAEAGREQRFIGGFFGPAPLPGDITSPVVCERYCRNRCLNGGYSGFIGVPGCNQFCDCSYYIRPGFFGK